MTVNYNVGKLGRNNKPANYIVQFDSGSGIVPSNINVSNNVVNVSGSLTASSGNFSQSLQVNGTGVSLNGHSHGNINSSGQIGSVANRVITTSDNGLLVANSDVQFECASIFIGASGDFINNGGMVLAPGAIIFSDNTVQETAYTGKIGSTSGLLVVTTTDGALTSSSGINSSLISNFNSSVSGVLPVKNITAGSGISINNNSGIYTINSTATGSSSTSVIEYNNVSNFPSSGVGSTIYISTDTGRIYRWASSVYQELGPVSYAPIGSDSRWDLFLPAAPTEVTAIGGNAQATVAWTAPTVVVPVTDYVIQYSSDSGSSWTTFADGTSTATSATVTGLTNGTSYVFRVTAVNGVGTGSYSSSTSSVVAGGDPYFSSVALLLHMDGTGSSFTDSSSSPKTVTANGNATQSTTQSKFGGKSAAFDGAGDYLSVPSVTLSGDFVFECWLQWNGAIARPFSWIAGGPEGTSSQFFLTTKSNRTGLRFGLTAVAEYAAGSFNWVPGTWYHVALVRSGPAIRFYVNGANVTDGFPTASNTFTGELRLAAEGSGSYDSNMYLDDVRLTVGNDRGYTGSTITVPTAAFQNS
jgi:hypothetical protein